MSGRRVFGLDENGMAVALGLKQRHEVLPRSIVFPHASGGGSNVGHLAHSATLDSLSDGLMTDPSVPYRDLDVSVFDRLRTDVHNVFIGDMNLLKFDLDDNFLFLLVAVLCHFCSLSSGYFGEFSLAQRCAVNGC